MNARPFLDTTVVVCAFTACDPRNDRAETLLAAGGVISVQVVNEFVNISRRKLRRSWAEIDEALGVLNILLEPPEPLTMDLHGVAIGIARRQGFSIDDSLIVAAALQARCSLLYSEDLQHGRKIEQLTIRNPFA